MKYVDEFRDPEKAQFLLEEIRTLVPQIRNQRSSSSPIYIMEVCGGHTHAIFRYGVETMLPDGIELIRRQVTLSAIRGICTKLGSLREGRKSLILLSEGFNATLPPQMRSNLPGAVSGTGDFYGDGWNNYGHDMDQP